MVPCGRPTVAATSIGVAALSRLERDGVGTIEGSYRDALNVNFARGMVSFVRDHVQKGPINVGLRLPPDMLDMSSLGLKAGGEVKVRGGSVELGGGLEVTLAPAELYAPDTHFNKEIGSEAEIADNLDVMVRTAIEHGNTTGLGSLLALILDEASSLNSGPLNMFALAGLRRLARVENAYGRGERGDIAGAVRDCIGLGPGLTPSSDDALAGMILACLLFEANRGIENGPARVLARAIEEGAIGRTTPLSQEYLAQAARGRGGEVAMALCEELFTGAPASVERETLRMLALGESSGTDTVVGIAIGTMLSIGRRTRLDGGV